MSNVKEDSILAQQIATNAESNLKDTAFHSSSSIYRFTNERMGSSAYVDAIKDKKKILSVVGSGDQILNSILLGSKDITGFDISVFPKYFLMLKLAAIKGLSLDEYLDFFIGECDVEFSDELYDKFSSCLNDEEREFWDSLFNYSEGQELYYSRLFSSEFISRGVAISRNPYLEPDNYIRLKSQIGDINLKFCDGNIFDIASDLAEGYNLINLSNIWSYIKGGNRLETYRKLLKSLPLTDDGLILTYLHSSDKRRIKKFEENLSSEKIFSKIETLPMPTDKGASPAIVLSKKR